LPENEVDGRSGFFTRLESLRGLAALMVACFHCGQILWGSESSLVFEPYHSDLLAQWMAKSLQVLFNGLGAVNIFFVLSGFVLASSIARGPAAVGTAAYRFILARLFRLFPAIWASVAILAIVQIAGEGLVGPPAPDAGTIVSNMLLPSTSMNGVMWTLQVEMTAIPLILLLALVDRRWRAIPMIFAIGTLFALSFVGAWTRGIGPYHVSFNFLLGFALGMLVCDAAPVVGRLNARQCALVFLLAIIPFFATRALLGKSTGDFRWITIIEFFSAAIMIAIIAYRTDTRFARLLDWPIMRFYGRISYSFYLLHPVMLLFASAQPDAIAAVLRIGAPDAIVAIALSFITIIATTPLAWLCWRGVETPGIALGRLVVGTWKTSHAFD
jgi:peptidoglycan/LPS O-acetylase OafA/YrhL